MNERINMIAGERRRVTVRVTYRGRQTGFTIQNPRYELKIGTKVIESGVPSMDYGDMICIIAPAIAGNYMLEFQFEIGGEQWIRRITVAVRE